ncbi:TVP38/TMEM64 family protein [Lactiplantibacillus daowaiensis]|uniref:TVP38/TMEM64 family protein n=1 Tax=Lactiplantibacillus daowaiensis TaxID=2559918 RepID=A0ABW1S343_9LACO|nr:VTT domain-containing protein [Lactiplantibacillus daowaiensis]
MKQKLSKRRWIILAVSLALVLVVLIGVRYHGTWQLLTTKPFSQAEIVAQVRRHLALDVLLVVPLLMAFSFIPGAPVSAVGIIAGICFGKGLGAALNIVGITLGNLMSQHVYGLLEARHTTRQPAKIVQSIEQMRHPFLGIVIGYTIPFIPTSLVSLAAVRTQTSTRQLMTATLIGSIPTAVIYALGGDALIQAHFKNLLWLAGVVILLLGLLWIIRQDRRRTKQA